MGKTGIQAGEGFVLLGKITKPHGVRGEVKVLPFTEKPESLKNYQTLFLSADDGATHIPVTILKVRVQGKAVVMQLQDCGDRNHAETLTGYGVWVKEKELPLPDEGEFYLYELEGKDAFDADGTYLGTVTTVLVGHGQDLLQINNEDREILIPFVSEFLVKRDATKIILNLPPGLIDING